MRFHNINFFIILPVIYHGIVSGLPSLKTSNADGKQPTATIPMQQFSNSKHSQESLHNKNITSEVKVTSRSELPQRNDLLTSKGLQDLYHEAYLLLKDVIQARKLSKNISTIDIHVKKDPKGDHIYNKTSSSRQTSLLGQSPLPPFKTRQKNSTSSPVTNSGVTSTINTSKVSNFSNSNTTENQANGYFKISTVDQANIISALLGENWKQNRTTPGPDEISFRNRTKQFPRNNTEWNSRKTLLFQNRTKDNGFLNNSTNQKILSYDINSTNMSATAFKELKLVLKTANVKNESTERSKNSHQIERLQTFLSGVNGTNKFTHGKNNLYKFNDAKVNWNSSTLQSPANNRTRDRSHTSSLSEQYNLLTQEIVVELGEKRDKRPDDTCFTGDVKYNQTLTFGLNAGQFTEETRAKTIEDCIYHCCSRKICDIAFMLKESCFLVNCHNKSSCYSRQAKSLSFHPRLAQVFRHSQHETDRPLTKGHTPNKPKEHCSYHEMIKNMTLHGGLDAGLFTSHGVVKTLNECAKYCCNEDQCDVAFMVDDICYSVLCKDGESCRPVETSHPKTKVSLAFISRGIRQPMTDIGKVKALSHPAKEQPEQVSWFCKANNISKIFTNVHLRGGLQAGNFTNKGVVSSYHQCVGYCCQDKHCNVAMTLRNNCFLVACKTYSDCLLQKVIDKDSQIVYVNWKIPTEEVLTKGKILYKDLGCWHERLQSLVSLEGTDDLLLDSYKSRRNKITKCATAARKRNFKVFALHNGGECRSGQRTGNIYQAHGKSRGCYKGIGNHVSNHVYHVKENGSLVDHGCWKAIQKEENFVTLESTDGRIKEKYKERNDPLLKCAEAAISQQHTLFALRDGGQCLAGSLKTTVYKKHGVSKLCVDGLGSDSSKSVYQIIGTTQLFLQQNKQKPFLAINTKKRQHAPQNSFGQSKLPSEKLPYKHSPPQSRVFIHGRKAGHFTNQGEVNNMAECIQHCGQQLNCSAAFMVRHFCFIVKCYSKKSCDTAPAVYSGFNLKLSFITHLASSMTSYKGKEERKPYETRPFAAKFQKNSQQKVNKSSALIKTGFLKPKSSNNSKRIPYKHSSPQSRVFIHGLNAGHFTHQGDINNMAECIQHCGQQLNCSAAFMVRHFCFIVKCYSKKSCDTAPAVYSGYNPKLSFITHLSPPMTSQPEPVLSRRCETSKIYENVTLFGGINAGNFTDFGQKENMSKCISSCCQQKHCDVAFMLGNDCYGVRCITKHLCGTTPAKHVKKYRPRLAYMNSKMENSTEDSQSLSSCWNGETLLNYTITGGIEAGIFYSNGNTDTMSTCMRYCCEQHDCDLAFRIDQGCYTVNCKDQDQCRAKKARKTRFLPQIAFKRPEVAMDEVKQHSTTDSTYKACKIGETHFNATLKMGVHSGKFKNLGRVDNMEDCIEMCCREKDIDAAFMLGKLCYSVKCYNSDLCQIRPAYVSSMNMLNVNPAVAFIHNNNDHKDYTRSEIERRCVGTSIKENTTLLGQIHSAGTFIDNGERSNIQDCISACCNTPSCDVALMQGKKCFSVQCSSNKTACQEVRADSSLNMSTLAYVARYMDTQHTQELELSTSSSQCPRQSLNELYVYKNKTLLGGFETGNYTFLGRTKNMQQCIQKCCNLGKCDVAYSIDGNCYGIECFSKNLCKVDDRVPDTTTTEISIMKDLKIKQSRRLSSYILPALPVLLVVVVLIVWLYWIRSRLKMPSSKT